MTPQLWIGIGFTAALVGFLMLTYFVKDTTSQNQYNSLRFLTALCAGFAGGFFAGEALFKLDQTLPGGAKLAISGTAGFALVFLVWITYPKREKKPLQDRIVLSIPAGWTFEDAARGIVKLARGIVHFEGFKPKQLSLPLKPSDINTSNVAQALRQLKYLSDQLPEYRVEIEDGVFHIRT